MTEFHVRSTLRVVYAVDGRPTTLTKAAAYRGAVLAAVARRCECYRGSNHTDDPSETCEYHDAIASKRYGTEPEYDGAPRRLRVVSRLAAIYKAEDSRTTASLERPALDLSHMSKDQLQEILVAVDWHIAHGKHRPGRRRASQ